MKRLDWFVARRYLASRKGGRLLSFITWVALGGVIVGVTALVVVIGVMTGMQEDLRDKILESNAHVLVLQQGTSLRMDGWRSVMDTIRATEGVTAAAPFVLTNAVLELGGYSQFARIYGVSTDTTYDAPTGIERDIARGVYDLETPESGLPPVLLGINLASRLSAFPGDTLNVVTLENIEIDPFWGPILSPRAFEVTGTFTTGMYEADANSAYTSLEAAQRFMGFAEDDDVSGLGVRIADVGRADLVAEEIQARLGLPYAAQSWTVRNRSLFSALKLEKLAMFVILLLIVIVAAFNIVSTLVMVVADRKREIGILKSMGMTDGTILRVFVFQGAWIGVVGTFIGTAMGLVACWVVEYTDLIRIPPEIYFVDRLPVEVRFLDIAAIVGASVLVALTATIYPSLQAARMEPVEAIRSE